MCCIPLAVGREYNENKVSLSFHSPVPCFVARVLTIWSNGVMDLFSDVTMNDDEDRNSIRYFSFGEENFTKLRVIVPL